MLPCSAASVCRRQYDPSVALIEAGLCCAFLQELKAQGVAFLVAPYEADAQMAYLARSGAVQVVVTEDSDLLAYGCPKCVRTLLIAGFSLLHWFI